MRSQVIYNKSTFYSKWKLFFFEERVCIEMFIIEWPEHEIDTTVWITVAVSDWPHHFGFSWKSLSDDCCCSLLLSFNLSKPPIKVFIWSITVSTLHNWVAVAWLYLISIGGLFNWVVRQLQQNYNPLEKFAVSKFSFTNRSQVLESLQSIIQPGATPICQHSWLFLVKSVGKQKKSLICLNLLLMWITIDDESSNQTEKCTNSSKAAWNWKYEHNHRGKILFQIASSCYCTSESNVISLDK